MVGRCVHPVTNISGITMICTMGDPRGVHIVHQLKDANTRVGDHLLTVMGNSVCPHLAENPTETL